MANGSVDSFRALSPEDRSRVATSLRELGYGASPEDFASYHDSSGGKALGAEHDATDWLGFIDHAKLMSEDAEGSLGGRSSRSLTSDDSYLPMAVIPLFLRSRRYQAK